MLFDSTIKLDGDASKTLDVSWIFVTVVTLAATKQRLLALGL